MGRVHVYDTSLSWLGFMTIPTSKDPTFYLHVYIYVQENSLEIDRLKFYSRILFCLFYFAKLMYIHFKIYFLSWSFFIGRIYDYSANPILFILSTWWDRSIIFLKIGSTILRINSHRGKSLCRFDPIRPGCSKLFNRGIRDRIRSRINRENLWTPVHGTGCINSERDCTRINFPFERHSRLFRRGNFITNLSLSLSRVIELEPI